MRYAISQLSYPIGRDLLEEICLIAATGWSAGIRHAAIPHDGERCEHMRFGTGVEYVSHVHASYGERVGDQRAMAPPRHCLGTHDRRGRLRRTCDQTLEPFREFAAFHVVCVSTEAGVAPGGVARLAA